MISDQEEGEINLTTNNKREEEEEQLSPNELMRKLEIIKDIKFVSP